MATISRNPTVWYSEGLPHAYNFWAPWNGPARQAVRDAIAQTPTWLSGDFRRLAAGHLVTTDQISQHLFSQMMQWLYDHATSEWRTISGIATTNGIDCGNSTTITFAKAKAQRAGAIVTGPVALSADRGAGGNPSTLHGAAPAMTPAPIATATPATTPAKETETVTEETTTPAETNAIPDVLAEARPWLAPAVLKTLEERIAVALDAAFAQGKANATPAPVAVETVPTGGVAERLADSTLGKVFGIKGKYASTPVQMWKSPIDRVPVANPNYVFDPARLVTAVRAIDACQPIWFGGPAGAGKTSLMREIAARTGRAFFRIDLNRQVELADLFGSRDLQNGSTYHKAGALLEAVQVPGAAILLDEVASLKPGVLIGLQTQLDERQIKLHAEQGRVVPFAPGVAIAAADNSLGSGDESGVYGDLHAMSVAFLDRFHKIVAVDYLSPDLESEALQRATGAPEAYARHVVAFANVVRVAAKKGGLSHTLTLRRMVALARDMMAGASPQEAFESTVEFFFPANDREAIRALWKANVVAATWVAALKPPAPGEEVTGQVATTRGAAAADAFNNA